MTLLYRLEGTLSGFSLFGSFLIIITYLRMKELRTHPINLVFYLSLCDFFFSLKFFLSSILENSELLQSQNNICSLQAIWFQLWGLASISYNGVISFNLLLTLRNPFAGTIHLTKWYHLFVWTLSITTTVLMKVYDFYGKSGDGTCWIVNNAYRLTFGIPLLVYFVLSIATLVALRLRLGSINKSLASSRKTLFRMSIFILVFILFWSFPLAHRIYQTWASDDDAWYSYLLLYGDAIGESLQGFANAFVWFLNPTFYKAFKQGIAMKLFPKLDPSRLPLLRQMEEEIVDQQQEVWRVEHMLRRYILTCLLQGIHTTVGGRNSGRVQLAKLDEEEIGVLQESFKFGDYDADLFQKLRLSMSIHPTQYLASMQLDVFLAELDKNLKVSSGRSGSFFCFTPDRKFVIKTITKAESKLLRRITPNYLKHIEMNPTSMLVRFCGHHAVKMLHGESVYVVVMTNIFATPRKIHEVYDLKGSWVNRTANSAEMVGMDMNLKRKLNMSSLHKATILDAVKKDTFFLTKLNIMDYSLLLGFHFLKPTTDTVNTDTTIDIAPANPPLASSLASSLSPIFSPDTAAIAPPIMPEESVQYNQLWGGGLMSLDGKEIYFLGVIDILQLYDLNKMTERFIKVYMLRKDKAGVSVQPPDIYCDRFNTAIAHIFQ